MPEPRPRIFVSHIAEEAALGRVIKDGLEDAFAGGVAVFVSSDPRDNPGGDDWLQKIKRELKDSQACMLISLVSPNSVREPWISIELGAAWILERGVFPLCHSGQNLEALPRPLQDFGGADLSTEESAKRLVMAVERATGLSVPTGWPIKAFLVRLRGAAARSSRTASIPVSDRTSPRTVPAAERSGPELPDEQVTILRVLAAAKDRGHHDGLYEPDLGQLTKLTPSVFELALSELQGHVLVEVEYSTYMPRLMRINPRGIKWLMQRGLL